MKEFIKETLEEFQAVAREGFGKYLPPRLSYLEVKRPLDVVVPTPSSSTCLPTDSGETRIRR